MVGIEIKDIKFSSPNSLKKMREFFLAIQISWSIKNKILQNIPSFDREG